MAEIPGVDRSGKVWELISAALEYGLEDGEIVFLARRFTPAVEKYAGRLDREVGRALGKGRARHQHPGQPCDRAGCPNTPDWMGGPPSSPSPPGGGRPDDGAEASDGDRVNFCPRGFIVVRASGRLQRLVRDCDRWHCGVCGPRRARVLAAEAATATADGALFAAELDRGQADAARRMTRRQKLGRLVLSRYDGGALVVCGVQLTGRTWQLDPVDQAGIVELALARPIRRADWSDGWRPEPEPPPLGSTTAPADPVVGIVRVGPRRLDAVVAGSGVVNGDRVTVSPAAAVAKLHATAHGRAGPRGRGRRTC
jgi:hypothetical protein